MRSRSVKVSVILPAYNAAGTLDRAVQSVLSQKGVDFELLIGNDASTDDTKARLQAYRRDPRIRIFNFRKNRGVSITRNVLIARAKGKYLSFCDADDILLPGNLKTFFNILERHSSIGAAYGDLWIRPLRGKPWIRRRWVPLKSWDLLGCCFNNGGIMIRRFLVEKVGGYGAGLSLLEDCDLLLRLAEITAFYYHPGKPLYAHNITPGSLSDQPLKKLKRASRFLLRETIQRRYGIKVKW